MSELYNLRIFLLQAESQQVQTISPIELDFLYLGAFLAITTFIITILRFINDYWKGSNVKFLETNFDRTPSLEAVEGTANFFVQFSITLIFVNVGNKSGVVDNIEIGSFKPDEVNRIEYISPMDCPFIIQPRDCHSYNLTIKLYFNFDTAMRSTMEVVEFNIRNILEWDRTHQRRNRTEVLHQTNKFNINVYFGGGIEEVRERLIYDDVRLKFVRI